MSKTLIGAQVPQKEGERIVKEAHRKNKYAFVYKGEFDDMRPAEHTSN